MQTCKSPPPPVDPYAFIYTRDLYEPLRETLSFAYNIWQLVNIIKWFYSPCQICKSLQRVLYELLRETLSYVYNNAISQYNQVILFPLPNIQITLRGLYDQIREILSFVYNIWQLVNIIQLSNHPAKYSNHPKGSISTTKRNIVLCVQYLATSQYNPVI